MRSQTQLFSTIAAVALASVMGMETRQAAGAAAIASYGFIYTPPTSLVGTPGTNVVASDVSFGAGSGIDPIGAVNGTLYMVIPAATTSAASALTNNSYFQFTVAPTSGYAMNMTNINFNGEIYSSDFAPSILPAGGFAVRSSVDGYASLIGDNSVQSFPTATFVNYDLSGAAFQNLTSPTTFRVYGYTNIGGAGTIGNFFVGGTTAVAAAPEPASLALLALGGLALLRRRRSA